MTDPNNPPLPIPDEAYAAGQFHPQGDLAERARLFARVVAAAELRRFADEFDEMAEHWENAGDEARASVYTVEKSNLHRRAIQLDGGAQS
jgi:hypothetical protein